MAPKSKEDQEKKRLYRKRTDPDFETFNRQFGERLKKLRLSRNLDQDDFARAANLHRSHISQIENARLDPTLSTLFKLAKAVDMSVGELLEPVAMDTESGGDET